MIKSIFLGLLRNSEFIQFCRDITKVLLNRDTEAMKVASQVKKLETVIQSMDGIFKSKKGSDLTTQLTTLDGERDEYIKGIYTVAEGYSHHHDAGVREAATNIVRSMEKYGSQLNKLNYQAETTTVVNLVQDWENKPQLGTALDLLGMTTWAQELKKKNQLFNDIYIERNRDEAMNNNEGLYELRGEAMEAFKDLSRHLEAHHTLGTSAEYGEVIAEINQLVEKYNQMVATRSSQGVIEESEEESL